MKEYFTYNSDGIMTGVHDENGIDEYMLEVMNILRCVEGKDEKTATALLCAVIEAVAEKYSKKPSDLTFDITRVFIRKEVENIKRYMISD